MIVALEEAKRRLVALEDVLVELGNQLRIEEAKERAAELERETMVQDFWNDAEKSSKKLREIKQLKDKVESYEELVAKLEDTLVLCEMAIEANDEETADEVRDIDEVLSGHTAAKNNPPGVTAAQVGAPTVAQMNEAIAAASLGGGGGSGGGAGSWEDLGEGVGFGVLLEETALTSASTQLDKELGLCVGET